MARYPDSFLEQLKNKIDIVDLISTYVNVQRKGRDYWACCPFHNEKTPSFQIRSDQQYYRCYGCGKYGNIFNFLMDYEQIPFGEAVEKLAKRAGLELPELVFDPQAQAKKVLQEKTYAINKETARFYYNNLFKDVGRPAREYFAKRGLDAKIVNIFGMGYSADFTSLPQYLLSKGYDDKSLLDACVVSRNQHGELIDFFGGRIIIPIIGGNGKVLGFTGRVLEAKPDFAKYKNTSNTAVFNKRKNLFSINLFKKERQGDIRSMILVEGHMDVISLYQAGIRNVVASMGTALTIDQCREIKRYADLIYVSFDGDSAGQHATLRGLDMLKEQGLDVKVVCLTDNLDPDDYVKKYGKDGYLKLLDEAMPLIDYKLMKIEENYNLNNSDERIKYAKAASGVLSNLDNVEKEIYAEAVSKKSGLKVESLIAQIDNGPVKETFNNTPAIKENGVSDAINSAERYVVSSFIYGKSYIDTSTLTLIRDCLNNEQYITVFDYYLKKISEGKTPKVSDLFDFLDDENTTNELLDAVETIPPAGQANYYYDCIKKLQKHRWEKDFSELTARLNSTTDNTEKQKIKLQINELIKAQPK